MKFLEVQINNLPEELANNIKEIKILETVSRHEVMVILKLRRDKHLQYKRAMPEFLEKVRNLNSVYTEYNGKYHFAGGEQTITDIFNNFKFSLSPYSPIKAKDQDKLYKKIMSICPKGTTRSAIIIDTHSGILPVHVGHLYNRIYGLENLKPQYNDAKANLFANKTNNCLMFNATSEKWLKEFSDHKYTSPGKTNKLGLAIINPAFLTQKGLQTLAELKPETIILFTKDYMLAQTTKNALQKFDFETIEETDGVEFKVIKMKWRANEGA